MTWSFVHSLPEQLIPSNSSHDSRNDDQLPRDKFICPIKPYHPPFSYPHNSPHQQHRDLITLYQIAQIQNVPPLSLPNTHPHARPPRLSLPQTLPRVRLQDLPMRAWQSVLRKGSEIGTPFPLLHPIIFSPSPLLPTYLKPYLPSLQVIQCDENIECVHTTVSCSKEKMC
ncbi:hypothetical protein CC86DRAFT_19076 [Ophiobolus disseminans]|uniref:Uncharacterized protein n=1 Tax=Ophiobolus disseminans TaxID=1469910 RepID=A0A6A7A258_9PLEO|nr:hypothetical protein CC86DRAFT_19076 [Ophiobolus disseminans]